MDRSGHACRDSRRDLAKKGGGALRTCLSMNRRQTLEGIGHCSHGGVSTDGGAGVPPNQQRNSPSQHRRWRPLREEPAHPDGSHDTYSLAATGSQALLRLLRRRVCQLLPQDPVTLGRPRVGARSLFKNWQPCLRLFKTVLSGFTPVRQLFIGDVGGDVTRAHCLGV